MGLYEMKRLLAPLGIYRLGEGDKALAELTAYDAGLRLVRESLQEMEREAFLSTAVSWGLSRREQLFGTAREGGLPEERRRRLRQSFSHVRGAWDRAAVLDAARELAEGVQLKEDAAQQGLLVSGLPRDEAPEWYRPLWQLLTRLLPAQIRFLFNTEKPDWDKADGYDKTFDELDYLDFAWDFLAEE